MGAYFFHYTQFKHLIGIKKTGIVPDTTSYTTDEYYDPQIAANRLRIPLPDCVLRVNNDGKFKSWGEVAPSRGQFIGGSQFNHKMFKMPTHIRLINGKTWFYFDQYLEQLKRDKKV